MNRHLMIGKSFWENVKIPNDYERLEYVLGNYTSSHFDTGISGDNNNLRFKICVELNFFMNYFYIFGNYIDEGTNCWRLLTATEDGMFYQTPNRKTGASGVINLKQSFLDKKLYFDLSQPKGYCYIKNERHGTTKTTTNGTQNTNNIIFGYSHVGYGSMNSTRRVKWYYFTVWDDGVMIRNYIPCRRKSDDKAGFYDTVNKEFKISEGSSDFILP